MTVLYTSHLNEFIWQITHDTTLLKGQDAYGYAVTLDFKITAFTNFFLKDLARVAVIVVVEGVIQVTKVVLAWTKIYETNVYRDTLYTRIVLYEALKTTGIVTTNVMYNKDISLLWLEDLFLTVLDDFNHLFDNLDRPEIVKVNLNKILTLNLTNEVVFVLLIDIKRRNNILRSKYSLILI